MCICKCLIDLFVNVVKEQINSVILLQLILLLIKSKLMLHFSIEFNHLQSVISSKGETEA